MDLNDLLNGILTQEEHKYNKPNFGIYFIFDKETQEVVYVGKTKSRDITVRTWRHLLSPFRKGNLGRKIIKEHPNWSNKKIKKHIIDTFSFRYIIVNNPGKLRVLEEYCINKLKPKYNVRFK